MGVSEGGDGCACAVVAWTVGAMSSLSHTYVYDFNVAADGIQEILSCADVDWYWLDSGKIAFLIYPDSIAELPEEISFGLGSSFAYFSPDELVEYAVKSYRASQTTDEAEILAIWRGSTL